MINNALAALKAFGAAARALDDEGLTIEIRNRGNPAVAVGRNAHSLVLDKVYGPIKVRSFKEVVELVGKLAAGT
ncbi:MAG: hypothetical protein WBZ42_09780 [Halobacteriota archaeon]